MGEKLAEAGRFELPQVSLASALQADLLTIRAHLRNIIDRRLNHNDTQTFFKKKKENETNQISLFIIPIKNPNPIAEP